MTSASASTVQLGRLETRGLILGLSAPQAGALSCALILAVVAEYASGAKGLVVTAPAWGLIAAVALIPVAGRSTLSWIPVVGLGAFGADSARPAY